MRGLTARCVRCGARGIFQSWFRLKRACPRCAYRFEREEGFFLGAYTMNLALVLAFLAVVMVVFIAESTSGGGAGVGGYLLVGVTGAVVIPVGAYPVSLTLWCALDYLMRGRLGGERL